MNSNSLVVNWCDVKVSFLITILPKNELQLHGKYLKVRRTLSIVPFCGEMLGLLGERLQDAGFEMLLFATPNCHSHFNKAWGLDLRNDTIMRHISSLFVLESDVRQVLFKVLHT